MLLVLLRDVTLMKHRQTLSQTRHLTSVSCLEGIPGVHLFFVRVLSRLSIVNQITFTLTKDVSISVTHRPIRRVLELYLMRLPFARRLTKIFNL